MDTGGQQHQEERVSYGPHFASEPVDASGNTALHIVATQMGGEEASDRIHVLLAMGANVEARNIEGATPLMLAAGKGKPEAVRELLRAGASVHATDALGRTALHCAAHGGRAALLQTLLRFWPDVNRPAADGKTPLHTAAISGQQSAVLVLLATGANQSSRTNRGFTPLHLAAGRGHVAVCEVLLHAAGPAGSPQLRACLDAQDEDGGTPLHLASHWGRAEAVQLLLQAGAYAGAAEAASGNTALHRVVRGWQRGRAAQYTATAAALLELGRADPCQPNAAGDTPLSLAAAAENESLVDLFQQSVERAQAGLLAFPGLGRSLRKAMGIRLGPGGSVAMQQGTSFGRSSSATSGSSTDGGGGASDTGRAPGGPVEDAARAARPQPCLAAAQQVHSARSSTADVDFMAWTIEFSNIQLLKPIGQGAFGQVFLGKWHETLTAVKLLLGSPLALQEAGGVQLPAARFSSPLLSTLQREAAILARLRHANVVSFYGVTTSPPAIVTEYCSRGSLADVLRAARESPARGEELSWPRRLHMMLDACKGVLHLHSNTPPILHRDIKSPNLLVDKNWCVKLADLNLSKILEAEPTLSSLHATNPRWQAPEVLAGQPATLESDCYSVGVVLHEMLTWQLPFPDSNHWQLLRFVMEGGRPPIPPRQDLPGKDTAAFEGLDDYIKLMQQCWAQEPEERPSIGRVIEGLRSILAKALPPPRPGSGALAAHQGGHQTRPGAPPASCCGGTEGAVPAAAPP